MSIKQKNAASAAFFYNHSQGSGPGSEPLRKSGIWQERIKKAYDVYMRCLLVMFVLLAVSTGHGQSWHDRSTEYNTEFWKLRTDLAPSEAADAAKLLDAMYRAYANGLSMLPKKRDTTFEAWVFKHKKDYNDALQAHRGGDSNVTEHSSGMFFTTRHGIQVTAVTVEESWNHFERVAKHEAFHQFAYSRFQHGIPQWLNEGIAEYFEASTYINGAIIPGQVYKGSVDLLKQDIRSNHCIPFLELLKMSNREWNQRLGAGNGALQYRQSWAMVHFLIHGENGRHAGKFNQYLLMIARGKNPEEAFAEAFGTSDMASFESAWAKYIEGLQQTSSAIAAIRLAYLATGAHALADLEQFPRSLQELRAMLQSIQFRKQITLNYHPYTFDSLVDQNYLIPPDMFSSEPQFVVERGHPLPKIYTVGLEPYDIAVKWYRQGGERYWTIIVE